MRVAHDEQHTDQDHPRVPRRGPDVDRSELWAALWGILSEAKDKITAELDVQPHPSGAGPGVLDHRGRRLRGLAEPVRRRPRQRRRVAGALLDRQPQGLDPGHEPPGLARPAHRRAAPDPRLRHGPQRLPLQRRGPAPRPDGRRRLPQPLLRARRTSKLLELRGDDRFIWSVSHGTYMRAFISPIANSYMADLHRRRGRRDASARPSATASTPGCGWVRDAQPVPVEERAALRERDHQVRDPTATRWTR